MSTLDTCGVCGFRRDLVTLHEVPERLRAATASFVNVINDAGTNAALRPSPERWSVLEYGAHARDVLIAIRERLITASIVDEPVGAPIYRDERVSLGFYGLDTPFEVANDLDAMADLFLRTLLALPSGFENRALIYSPITPEKVTIRWLGAQALHECEHHLGDARDNLTLLAGRSLPSN